MHGCARAPQLSRSGMKVYEIKLDFIALAKKLCRQVGSLAARHLRGHHRWFQRRRGLGGGRAGWR